MHGLALVLDECGVRWGFESFSVASTDRFFALRGPSLSLLQAAKLECITSPIFLLSWSVLMAIVCVAGSHPLVQYCLVVVALTTLHTCDSTSETPPVLEAAVTQ